MAATVLWAVWVQPVNDANVGERPFGWGLVLGAVPLTVLAQWGVASLARRVRGRLGELAGVAWVLSAVPLGVCLLGLALLPSHTTQRRLIAVFDAYTRNFPSGYLRDSSIIERDGRRGIVCRSYGNDARYVNGSSKVLDPREFCTVVDLDAPVGRRVRGGFRLHSQYDERFRCFGDVSCAR